MRRAISNEWREQSSEGPGGHDGWLNRKGKLASLEENKGIPKDKGGLMRELDNICGGGHASHAPDHEDSPGRRHQDSVGVMPLRALAPVSGGSSRRLEEPGWKRRALDPTARIFGQVSAMGKSRSTSSLRPEAAFLASMARRVSQGQPVALHHHLMSGSHQDPRNAAAAAFVGRARPRSRGGIAAEDDGSNPRDRLMWLWATVYVDAKNRIPALTVRSISDPCLSPLSHLLAVTANNVWCHAIPFPESKFDTGLILLLAQRSSHIHSFKTSHIHSPLRLPLSCHAIPDSPFVAGR